MEYLIVFGVLAMMTAYVWVIARLPATRTIALPQIDKPVPLVELCG